MSRAVGAYLWAAGLLAGCAATDEGPSGPHAIYLGAVEGTDAVVAFVVDEADGAVNSYVCGGPTSYAELSRWFCGDSRVAGDGSVSFEEIVDGFAMIATVDDGRIDGAVSSLDGTSYAFEAARVPPGSRTDLFGSNDLGGCATGAIVIDDVTGGEPRVQGTFCLETADGRIYDQVTPLAPPDIGDTHFQVFAIEGGESSVLSRIRP